MKKQSKKDKAFIAKLKTLTVGTGSSSNDHGCPQCGDLLELTGIAVAMPRGWKPPHLRNNPEEQTVTE